MTTQIYPMEGISRHHSWLIPFLSLKFLTSFHSMEKNQRLTRSAKDIDKKMKGIAAALLIVFAVLSWSLCVGQVGHGGLRSGAQDRSEDGSDKLTVHIVAHTHDDVGWLLTVDQYFQTQTRYIVTSVVSSLLEDEANNEDADELDDESRRFSYVEMAFMSRWWEEQSEARKADVRRLVKQKRFQFLNGGWCMNDEAGPLFVETIDQLTRGHQFILKEFGPNAAPRAAWQIDPFGHTNAQARISAESGMPSLFWARMNYADREARKASKELEYIWRASKSLGKDAEVLGGMIWGKDGTGLYDCPFHFEEYLFAGLVVGNPQRHDYNIDSWVNYAVNISRQQAENYKTNNIQMTCGMDFNYKNAATWFHNLDLIMKAVNKDGRIRMRYSTPAEYADALNAEKSAKWSVRSDDLMPLHEHPHQFWTGYFSSRVPFKRLLRQSSNMLQAARQLAFAARIQKTCTSQVHRGPMVGGSFTDAFEAAVAISTHHDAVSGTAKQAVNNDYAQRISEAQEELENGMAQALGKLTGLDDDSFFSCRRLNISICEELLDKGAYHVVLWNPLSRLHEGHVMSLPVRLESDDEAFEVQLISESQEVSDLPHQLVEIDNRTHSLPLLYLNQFDMTPMQVKEKLEELKNHATHVLKVAVDLPSLSATVVRVSKIKDAFKSNLVLSRRSRMLSESKFDNGKYEIELDKDTSRIMSITNLETGTKSKLNLNWGFYHSAAKECTETGCGKLAVSGAYLFRPNSSKFFPVSEESDFFESMETSVSKGPISTEITQMVSPWVSHTIRLDQNQPYIEVEFTVGPIPISDGIGKEIVLRYETDLETKGSFFTDSNGLEMEYRMRALTPDSYPEPREITDEPIAGNYFPINSMISARESNRRSFTIVVDSSQGGSSNSDGMLELMVHRRVLHDDHKGVEEPLNETMCGCNGASDALCFCQGVTIRGIHRLLLEEVAGKPQARIQAERLHFPPVSLFSEASESDSKSVSSSPSILAAALPESVRVLTITNNYDSIIGDNAVLVRLHHIYSADEIDARPETVNLGSIFAGRKVVKAIEKTLTGNMNIEDKPMYEWNNSEDAKTQGVAALNSRVPFNSSSMDLVIKPMEIRTFAITFEE